MGASDFVYELKGNVVWLSVCVFVCEFNKLKVASDCLSLCVVCVCVTEVHQTVAMPLITAFTSMLMGDNI